MHFIIVLRIDGTYRTFVEEGEKQASAVSRAVSQAKAAKPAFVDVVSVVQVVGFAEIGIKGVK